MSAIAARCAQVRDRIAAAAERAHRSPQSVHLIAVSKGQSARAVLEAATAGQRLFGENRVQEARGKMAEIAATRPALSEELEWHLLGPLQSNKARVAVESFAMFHAVDRLDIARVLDRETARRATGCEPLPVFLEVNIASESTKHGFDPDPATFLASISPLSALPHIRVVGLMAVPPFAGEPEASRPWFRRLRELRDRMHERPEWDAFAGHLSMGMSGDFEIAIEEGSTHTRVGTAIFGERSS